MKATLALPAIVLLSISMAACGSASNSTTSKTEVSSNLAAVASAPAATPPTSSGSYWKYDSDTDSDDNGHSKGPSNDDAQVMAASGRGASRADKQTITAVVGSYYRAASASDGAKGCALLYLTLFAGLAEGQGQSGTGRNGTCAAALTRLFKQQHQHLLAEDVTTMTVTGVHVNGDLGLVTLGFRKTPEGELLLQREGRLWKVDALFDSELP